MFILRQRDSAKYLKQVCNKTAHSALWCGPSFIWASKMSPTMRFPTPPMDILHSKKNPHCSETLPCICFLSVQNSSYRAASSSSLHYYSSLLELAPSTSFWTVSIYLLCYYWPMFSLSSFSLVSQISSNNSSVICCLHLKSLQFADFSNAARIKHIISHVILAKL